MKSRFWNRPRAHARRMIMEALEERIVLDAAVDHVLQADQADIVHHTSTPLSMANISPFMLTEPISVTSHAAAAASAQSGGALDVILVSDALEGSQQIANAALPGAKVIVYSAQNDNLSTLNAKLSELVSASGHKIRTLAVASHGGDGLLQLGTQKVDLDSAASHQTSFRDLGKNLSDHSQIQFYSCSLASSPKGVGLVNALAAMTGATVYASSDTTGAAPNNWTLEYSTDPHTSMLSLFDAGKLEKAPGQLAQLPATTLAPSNPGVDSFGDPVPGASRMPLTLANEAVFSADNGAGREVFKTPVVPNVANGTVAAAQTALTNFTVLDPHIRDLTQFNGNTYYSAFNTSATGDELMRSAPTDVGAAPNPISNFAAGVNAYDPHISQLTAQGNSLFFVAQQAGQPADRNAIEVWRTNGGPNLGNVTDFGNNAITRFGQQNGSDLHTDIRELSAARDGQSLYFVATSPRSLGSAGLQQGMEVWRTTGTVPGAGNVTDVGGGERGAVTAFGDFLGLQGYDADISQLTIAQSVASNRTAYFVANDPAVGYEVWRTDGTPPSAVQVAAGVRSLNANVDSGAVTQFGGVGAATNPGIHDLTFVPANGGLPNRIYFVGDNNDGFGAQIWRSDGGPAGASVTDRGGNARVTAFGVNADISQLVEHGGALFFVGNNPSGGTENYEVFRVTADANPANADTVTAVTNFPNTPTPVTPRTGIPTDVSLQDPIRAQLPAHTNAHIKLLTFSGNTLWFEADSENGASRELYSVDSTLSGQQPVQRTNFSLADPDFAFLSDVGGSPVFVARNGSGQEIFTVGNTQPVNMVPTNNNADPLDVYLRTVLEDGNNHNVNVPLHSLLRMYDPDGGDTLTVRVQAMSGFQAATGNPVGQRALEFVVPAGNTATANADTPTGSQWTITAPVSWQALGDINTVLSTLSARLTLDSNSATDAINGTTHTIRMTTFDGVAPNLGVTNDINLVVTPVNDQPVFNPVPFAPFPGAQNVSTIDRLTFNDAHGNRVAVGDVDAYEIRGAGFTPPDGQLQITVEAGAGAITMPNRLVLGVPLRGQSLTFTDTIANINNALDGMTYTPAPYFEGPTMITLALDDTNPFLGGTLPFPAGVGPHSGQPESGAVSALPPVPAIQPVYRTIAVNVTPPAGDVFGRLYDRP